MQQTLENLTKAFVGESQARNRYSMYASAARKEGYLQIADIFEQTADQEKEHASWFFKMIQMVKAKMGATMNEVAIETGAFVKIGTTLENLGYSAAGEHHEYDILYPEFARVAQEEGFPEIAARIRNIAIAEQHHEERYLKLWNQLNDNTLRVKADDVRWMCTKCGHLHKGKSPLEICPSCGHDKTYAIVQCEMY